MGTRRKYWNLLQRGKYDTRYTQLGTNGTTTVALTLATSTSPDTCRVPFVPFVLFVLRC